MNKSIDIGYEKDDTTDNDLGHPLLDGGGLRR